MALLINRSWSALAVRGVAAILFGLTAIAWPGISLAVLLGLFAGYALIGGGFAIIAAVRSAEANERWWPLLIEGIVSVAFGVFTLARPHVTTLVLLYTIAFWAISTGLLEILAAIRLRREIDHEWTLGLGGLLSILFGVLVAARPAAGLLTVVWLIGAYGILFGVVSLSLALRLRGRQHDRLATA